MPADSFESPLTLAACGGHVELAMLLLERGANIEEVSGDKDNDNDNYDNDDVSR